MPRLPVILIFGASGRLGGSLRRAWADHFDIICPTRSEADFDDPEGCAAAARKFEFNVLVNCAAMTSPEVCEERPEPARKVNAMTPGTLAKLCQERAARMIHISTDYVFSGDGTEPLTEDSPTGPVNVYGKTKLEGENLVLSACPAALVARVSWLFGGNMPSFPDMILAKARAGQPLCAIGDKWGTPTSTVDLASWLTYLITEHPTLGGLIHLCNSGAATWHEYAKGTVDAAYDLGLLPTKPVVEAQALDSFEAFRARRPRFTPMSAQRFASRTNITPLPWQEALRQHLLRQMNANV